MQCTQQRSFELGSVDVSFAAAFGPVLGLSRKMAIHCVMLLDNNPLLPSLHALCLAVFRLSAMANETSTDPRFPCEKQCLNGVVFLMF